MRLEKEGPAFRSQLIPLEYEKVQWSAATPAQGGVPPVPTVASTVPGGGREVLVGYIRAYNSHRCTVKGVIFGCGAQASGATATKVRLAIMGADGLLYTGGSETALPTTVVGGLKMATGATWQSGRTTGMNSAESRSMRFTFDEVSILEPGPFYLAVMSELMYTSADTVWSNNFWHGDWIPLDNSKVQSSNGSTGRPIFFNALGTAGIDSESWATYESPTTGELGSGQRGSSQTISTKTVGIGNIHSLMFHLECQI